MKDSKGNILFYGDRVRVIKGKHKGLEGELDNEEGSKLVVIVLNSDSPVVIEVDSQDLVKVD